MKFTFQLKKYAAAVRGDLPRLALLSGTDKWGIHWYAEHYARHFKSRRLGPLKILEIGVGGGENLRRGGASLRMWKYYFPRGHIFSIDIYDKSALEESRITIFQGDQSDAAFLHRVIDRIGTPDIIIDDGSHVNEHVIVSFETLFPLLAKDGLYCVEDMQTSYWKKFGGSAEGERTSMNYFKKLCDGLNWQERPGYIPNHFEQHIISMHWYHNLLIMEKGVNDEKSNILK